MSNNAVDWSRDRRQCSCYRGRVSNTIAILLNASGERRVPYRVTSYYAGAKRTTLSQLHCYEADTLIKAGEEVRDDLLTYNSASHAHVFDRHRVKRSNNSAYTASLVAPTASHSNTIASSS